MILQSTIMSYEKNLSFRVGMVTNYRVGQPFDDFFGPFNKHYSRGPKLCNVMLLEIIGFS